MGQRQGCVVVVCGKKGRIGQTLNTGVLYGQGMEQRNAWLDDVMEKKGGADTVPCQTSIAKAKLWQGMAAWATLFVLCL
jgi:hypothetical protein